VEVEKYGVEQRTIGSCQISGQDYSGGIKRPFESFVLLGQAKDKSSLLDALRQISRRIAGLKSEEREKYKGFIYPPSLEDVVLC